MARDYISLSSTPYGEDCAQVGSEGYSQRMRAETAAYIAQLKREHGEPPPGARLYVKSFPHDFGTYHEVVVEYEVGNEDAEAYAFTLDENQPEYWDAEAREELGL